MGVIITITLPASEFAIGRVIETVDGVHIELQTVVPLGGHVMPLLDVYDCDHDVFAERLQEHPAVESVVAVEQSNDEGVYAVEWTDDLDSFYQALSDQNGTILQAVKEGKDWEFDLLFLSHESLTAFREQINEAEISFDVRRVSRSNHSVPDPRNGLSAAQREALDLAISEGYYSIPRETTTKDIGDQLGISDQAVVERLRRAMRTLGEEHIEANWEHQRA